MENTKLAADQQRISNLIIDTIFIYLVYALIVNSLMLTGWIVYMIIYFSYYFIFESTTRRTIGKFITKTRVVGKDGDTPKLSSLFFRTLLRCIPFEILSFLGSKNPTGWHDDLSNTRVEKI